MDAKKELERAKVQLILNEPFFASCALRFNYIFDETLPHIAGTNGIDCVINPTLFQQLKMPVQKGLLAHEVMHVVMMHHLRIGNRDPKMWNVACDYAINPILIDAGFELPKGGLLDKKYYNKSAEEIYSLLPSQGNQQNNVNQQGNETPEFGNVEAPPEGTDLKELEQEVKQMISQSQMLAKQAENFQIILRK